MQLALHRARFFALALNATRLLACDRAALGAITANAAAPTHFGTASSRAAALNTAIRAASEVADVVLFAYQPAVFLALQGASLDFRSALAPASRANAVVVVAVFVALTVFACRANQRRGEQQQTCEIRARSSHAFTRASSRVERNLRQAGGARPAQREIEGLHRLGRSAPGKIVDRSDRDDHVRARVHGISDLCAGGAAHE